MTLLLVLLLWIMKRIVLSRESRRFFCHAHACEIEETADLNFGESLPPSYSTVLDGTIIYFVDCSSVVTDCL
jgi:hypothetical protein